jgi:hypothetical protein
MNSKRKKVTVSLYDQELIAIENLKNKLHDLDLKFLPSTSEVVRIALAVMVHASQDDLEKAIANTPDRITGRPKQTVF